MRALPAALSEPGVVLPVVVVLWAAAGGAALWAGSHLIAGACGYGAAVNLYVLWAIRWTQRKGR